MKKPKIEEEEEDKQDNLEITAIGNLYKGPWDKKYWSSSRGKDRYPYPIGYQAVRTHSGKICKMEIHEGLNGPQFVIISGDGQSCCGQTPDIAWGKYQKKGLPCVKLLNEKRLSCKIDGVEFFGFRNPFVQRLLRELVADVNKTAEQDLLSSSLHNGTIGTEQKIHYTNPCPGSDLLPFLERPQVTGHRSKKHNVHIKKLTGGASPKNIQPQDLSCIMDASKFRKRNHKVHYDGDSTKNPDSEGENVILTHPGAATVFLNLKTTVSEKNKQSAPHVLLSDLSSEKNPLDKSSTATEHLTQDDRGSKEGNFYAPDTLDFLQDNNSDPPPPSPEERPNSVKDELTLDQMTNAEGPSTNSLAEEATGTSMSDGSSQKNDSDSLNEDVAKSMMSLLLPQALPLLKKTYRRKRRTINPSEVSLCVHVTDTSTAGMQIENPSEKNDFLNDDCCSEGFEHMKSVIPDSFQNYGYGEQVADQIQHSDFGEAGPDTDNNACIVIGEASLDTKKNTFLKKSSVCHVESCNDADILFRDIHMALKERSQKTDILKHGSAVGSTSSTNEILSGKSKDPNTDFNKESHLQIPCEEEHKTASDDEDESDANLIGKVNIYKIIRNETSDDTGDAGRGNISSVEVTYVASAMRNFEAPPLDSTISRSFADGCATKTFPSAGANQVCTANCSTYKEDLVGEDARCGGKILSLLTKKPTVSPRGMFNNMDPVIPSIEASVSAFENNGSTNFLQLPTSHVEKSHSCTETEPERHKKVVQSNSSTSWCQKKQIRSYHSKTSDALASSVSKPYIDRQLEEFVQLVGSYVHPLPVLSVLLGVKENEVYVCTLCGLFEDNERTLFMYKLDIKKPRAGCPSFVGHTSIIMPILKCGFGREIVLEKSGLQFSPDGQSLVLLSSIKVPHCREGKISCLCSECTSDSFEENAVKIVQMKLGFVSVVTKLKTDNSVHCILVCEPNHLVAVEEGGKLHLWVMNSTWSAVSEEFVMPTYDCLSPSVVELKQIPMCSHLIIGHNGFGEFGFWDISRRVLVSRFSAPSISISQLFPISLFNWKRKDHLLNNPSAEQTTTCMIAAKELCISEQTDTCPFLPSEEQDIAIWLLISTVPDSDVQHEYHSNCQMNPDRRWRLALLVKNTVVLGSLLDPRAVAVGASDDHGILATCDGLVYMWELSTGTKIGTLHHFKGGSIPSIATDGSKRGILAIADGDELVVYLRPQSNSTSSI